MASLASRIDLLDQAESLRTGSRMWITTELLARVSSIRMKHELIAELTGENFNIFSILGLQSYENRTHSAFLRELLDPRGSHGMGDAFLKAFVRLLRAKFSKFSAFKLGDSIEEQPIAAKVVTELHLGYKSEDLSEGGRIDLVISPDAGGWKILIENKINAGDQECQVVRYYNSDQSALLLYLTLEGNEAPDYSVSNQANNQKLIAWEDYIPISYRNHILAWLEDCAKEASSRPLVRETLVQYAHLIRTLTHQNSSNLMTQEITKTVLSSKETLLSYASLYDSWQSIRAEMLKSIEIDLRRIAEREGFETTEIFINLEDNGSMQFGDHLLKKNNLKIGFGCDDGVWYFGYCRLQEEGGTPDEPTRTKLEVLKGEKVASNLTWPVSRWWREVPNWLWDRKNLANVYFDRTEAGIPLFVEGVASRLKEMKLLSLGLRDEP